MKNKAFIRIISFLLILPFLVSNPISAYAKEYDETVQSDLYGRLPVYLLDDGGDLSYLEVYRHKNDLYVQASSFASRFGYSIGYTDDGVQFLQTENSSDEDYSWTFLSNFKNRSRSVWVYDGVEVTNYTAPCKTIKNDHGTWIPLQFAIKIMGREMVINSGLAVVSEPHETINTIINNVAGADSRLFPVIVEFNDLIEETDVATTTSHILTQAIASESEKNSWIGRAVNKSVPIEAVSKAGVDELATYLVANLGPENTELIKTYYELMLMYMDQGYIQAADSIIDEAFDTGFSSDTSYEEGKNIIESYANAFAENNCATINYNYAFENAYSGLTGYSPISKEWTNEFVYNDFLDTMITYKGNPSETTKACIDYCVSFVCNYASVVGYCGSFVGRGGFASFVGDLNTFNTLSEGITEFYVFARCARNILSENTYSRDIFENYLLENKSHTADSDLIKSLSERVENFTEYQIKVLDEQIDDINAIDEEEAIDDTAEVIVDKIDDKMNEYIPGPSHLYKTLYNVFSFGYDLDEFLEEYDEKIQNELIMDNTNYILAKGLADEIGRYVASNKDANWAYIFYRTDYISNYYHYMALDNINPSEYSSISEEDISEIRSLLYQIMNEDTYQLASLRSGVNYGLNPKDNTSYNNNYEDSKYIALVEEISMSKGNSNANINNCGFATTSTNYKFYVDTENNYKAYMESLDKKGSAVEVSNSWAHWLNAFEKDGVEYLIYVNENMDLCSYNTESGKTVTLSDGNYSNAMVAFGYIFAKEKGALCRLELLEGSRVGEKKRIVPDVGECVVYDDDMILFADKTGEVYKTDIDGIEKIDLGINSDSFDLSNGNLYFSNNIDNRTLYIYNIMTGISTKLGTTENTYCINVNNGLVYFKIDDGKSSSLVYSIVPFVDTAIPRVYSWKGTDEFWGVSNIDIVVASGRDGRRVYNISDGKIYNEGYMWTLTEYPLAGISGKSIIGFISYKISDIINSDKE